jgi:hypothetical protein
MGKVHCSVLNRQTSQANSSCVSTLFKCFLSLIMNVKIHTIDHHTLSKNAFIGQQYWNNISRIAFAKLRYVYRQINGKATKDLNLLMMKQQAIDSTTLFTWASETSASSYPSWHKQNNCHSFEIV